MEELIMSGEIRLEEFKFVEDFYIIRKCKQVYDSDGDFESFVGNKQHFKLKVHDKWHLVMYRDERNNPMFTINLEKDESVDGLLITKSASKSLFEKYCYPLYKYNYEIIIATVKDINKLIESKESEV